MADVLGKSTSLNDIYLVKMVLEDATKLPPRKDDGELWLRLTLERFATYQKILVAVLGGSVVNETQEAA